jgi:putative SOS response-associated peptidase YedK
MCGRYVSKLEASLEREWNLTRTPSDFESYNIAPGQQVPVVRIHDGGHECTLMRWGLVPHWAKGVPPKYSTINARVEGITTAPSYRDPWKRGQRCILPALGFYEWQVRNTGKQPYYIHLEDQAVFGFAGLYDFSTLADGPALESCTIITMPANHLLAEIHNAKQRMPAILRREDHEAWLSGDADAARACLQPYPDELMAAHEVSIRVNSPKNNTPDLLEPVE